MAKSWPDSYVYVLLHPDIGEMEGMLCLNWLTDKHHVMNITLADIDTN